MVSILHEELEHKVQKFRQMKFDIMQWERLKQIRFSPVLE